MERFIAKLKEIGYKGPLTIEREASDPGRSGGSDIAMGVELLRRLGRSPSFSQRGPARRRLSR